MKIIPSSQVGRLIPDGASVLLTGITLGGYAEEAFLQIERSFWTVATRGISRSTGRLR